MSAPENCLAHPNGPCSGEVVLPAALPVIFTGLYIAIGVAWLMVVAGEMIANKGGIGAWTWQSYQTTQYPMIFVGMASIGILGYSVRFRGAGCGKVGDPVGAVRDSVAGAKRSGLHIESVGKVYETRQGSIIALESCSFQVKPGGFTVLVGPSGCGKTTLLNIIAGFDSPSIGEVRLGNDVIASHDGVLQSGPDRMVVFQHGGLFPWMTVIENVCYGPIIQRSMAPSQARDAARRMLSRVGAYWNSAKR